MNCVKLLFSLSLSLILSKSLIAQQTLLVEISAKVSDASGCSLIDDATFSPNSITIRLNDNSGNLHGSNTGNAKPGVTLSSSIPLANSSFSGSIGLSGSFRYSSNDCVGWSGGRNELEHFIGIINETIPVNFTGMCLNGANSYNRNTVEFELEYSFRLVMTAPVITPSSTNCNTNTINLQVNSTAPSYNWQVLNPMENWITFRNNASSSILATVQELQTAAGNGAYSSRNVRAVESGCLSNRNGPSSEVFNFHVPPPAVSITPTDQTCYNLVNGSLAVTITSALSPTINDFTVRLHDPLNPINPTTGYSPAISEIQLENSASYVFQNLGTANSSSKSYYITVQNNTDNLTYGSCIAFSQNYVINNPTQIVTGFAHSLKNGYDVSCNGGSNGQITVLPSGGAGNYHSFSWNNGATTQSVSGLSAGNYSVTYRDAKSCLASEVVTITQPPTLSVSIQSNNRALFNNYDVSCLNQQNGSLSAFASGGAGNYSYLWNAGPNTSDYGGLGVGDYSVTASDGNGCIANSNITLTAPPQITFSIDQLSPIDCPGVSTGSLSVDPNNIQNEIGAVSYAWSNGVSGTSNTLQDLPAGNYSVTITDAQGCTAFAQRSLTNPLPYTVGIAPQSNYEGNFISCNTAADGILGATLFDPNQNPQVAITFNWFNGETPVGVGATAYGLNEGTYRAVATYNNGCTAEHSYFLEAPEPYETVLTILSSYNGSAISCNGASDGVLSATLQDYDSNPVIADNYIWSRNGLQISQGELLSSINNLNEGTYNVVATYNEVCSANATILLTDPDPVVTQIQATTDYNGFIVSCVGENDGELQATASGGTGGGYTFEWNTGFQEALLSNVTSGIYSVIVRDINNCSAIENFVIDDPPVMTAFAEVASNFSGYPISCTGESDGILIASAEGGTGNFTFQWSTGVNSQILNNIPAGNYGLIAMDENGCAAETTLSILDPPIVEVSITQLSDYNGEAITCAGESNARLQAIGSGGTNSFSYSWNIGSQGSIQNGLGAGLYTVEVSDGNGCMAQAQQIINEPLPVAMSIVNISDYHGFGVTCAGSTDAFMEVTAQGGTGAFTYNWLNYAETGNTLEQVGEGSYTVIVTDSNGCSDEVSILITEPQALMLTVIDKQDIDCFGGSNGFISINAFGGVGNYTFSIDLSDPAAENQFTSLQADEYTLHAYDANNCHTSISETLVQPAPIEIEFENIEPAFCDDPRGKASAIVSGGVLNYSYQWRNNLDEAIDSDNTIENLAAGLYTLQVVDGNNCEASKFLGISATDGPMVAVDEIIPAKCSYTADGSISMEVIEGDGPFTFYWQDGQTSATATHLAAGEYNVLVRDINNCQTVSSAIVTAPAPLSISLIELTAPTCYGLSDGSIEVSGSGGTAPYTYDWGIFQGARFTGRSKGNSYLKLYDANQCSTQAHYFMPEPSPLSLSVVSRTMPSCFGACDGEIQVSASGGNGEYNYSWDNGNQHPLAANVCSSNHTVTVHDGKGCALTKTYYLDQPTQLAARLLSIDSPDCHDGCDGKLEVDAVGGVGNYSYQWSTGQVGTALNDACAGSYTISILDGNGCLVQQSHKLNNPDQVRVDLGENKTLCEGQTYTLAVSGAWLSYQWNSNTSFHSQSATVLLSQAGQYWLEVRDALGCMARDTFLLETSTNLLEASFIIPAEAQVNDTVAIIDITWPLAESIQWNFPSAMTIVEDRGELVLGKFQTQGIYTINLLTKLAACIDDISKSILILGDGNSTEENVLGYKEFVKTFEMYPNPTQGKFVVHLQFAEASFTTLSVWEITSGKSLKQYTLESATDAQVDFDLHALPPGSYVLRMDYAGGVKYIRFVVN